MYRQQLGTASCELVDDCRKPLKATDPLVQLVFSKEIDWQQVHAMPTSKNSGFLKEHGA